MTEELMLFGIAELAKRWEVTPQRVHRITAAYMAHGKLAAPQRLKCGPIWTEPQIEEFEEVWVRRNGRPSRSATTTAPSEEGAVEEG